MMKKIPFVSRESDRSFLRASSAKIGRSHQPLSLSEVGMKSMIGQRDKSPATKQSFDSWRSRILADNGAGLRNEFATLKNEPAGTCSAFKTNTPLNRYGNVPLLDDTRVMLNDGLDNDYIHASRVDGYRTKNGFIVTQAPLRTTVRDYWRMVWQEKVQVCVCLTALQEDGAEKSTHFFPTSVDRPFRAGPLRILLTGTEEQPSPRRLVVARMKLYCWFAPSNRRERNIFMVFYGDWPDRGVPANPVTFLDVFDGVRQLQQNAWRQMRKQIDFDPARPMKEMPPLLVNCSAGIGRSASLVASLIEVERLRDTQEVDLMNTVRRLRRQRAGAVQNVMQYVFIARVIIEAWMRMEDEDESVAVNPPSPRSLIGK